MRLKKADGTGSIYIKFANEKNLSLVVKIRRVVARSSSDFDEAQGSLFGCPQPIKLILSPAHSCQQQAFTEHPLYFTRFLWRWGEHLLPTGNMMLALETSQKPSVSRGHSQPQGPGDITKEISPFYLAASGGESADLCTRCA